MELVNLKLPIHLSFPLNHDNFYRYALELLV
jgi:hypothetical protein